MPCSRQTRSKAWPRKRGRAGAVARLVGEGSAIVGQQGVDPIWERLDDATQEGGSGEHVGGWVKLDVGELRDAIDGQEEEDLSNAGPRPATTFASAGIRNPSHTVPSRGTRRFGSEAVFGKLGVLQLRRMHVALRRVPWAEASRKAGCGKSARPV